MFVMILPPTFKSFAASAVIVLVMLMVSQCPPALAAETANAKLNAPAVFQITLNGQPVGTTTMPSGTKVIIVRENPDTAETLVRCAAGQTWIPKANISALPLPTPSPTQPPKPAQATATNIAQPQRPRMMGTLEVVREIPYPTRYIPPQIPASTRTRTAPGQSQQPIIPATPTGFQTRKVGVVLQTGSDGSQNFQMTEFDGFIDYGPGVKQPVFSQTSLKTSAGR